MEENFKNKLGFWTFTFIVLFLAIGGYFFTDYILNIKDVDKIDENKDEVIDYRIDKDKDYIYFINEETISESGEIYYQDVVINLSTQNTLTETLEKENKIYKNNIKYLTDDDVNILSNDLIHYNNDNLYALTTREYKTYEYQNFVSLLINDYTYTCFDGKTFSKTKSYIFDTSNGKLLSNEEVLSEYDTNIDNLKNKIREHLQSKQEIIDEEEYLKIDDTINDLNNYSLYINEYGNLYISYLVKTSKEAYNEIMEV